MSADDWSMVMSALRAKRDAAEDRSDHRSAADWTRLMAEVYEIQRAAQNKDGGK